MLIQRIFWPVFFAALAIARVIRLVNGAKLDCVFKFTRIEQNTLYLYLILLLIYGAFTDSTARLVEAVFACIVAIGLIGKRLHSRQAVKPPAPNPDGPSEPN